MSAKLGYLAKLYYGLAAAISNIALTSNVVTITTATPHGYTAGDPVTVAAIANTVLNGTFAIIATPTSTTFTYALTHANIGSVADTGTTNELLEITNVKDVTLTLDKAEADATTRASAGWKVTLDGLKDAAVEWDMIWDSTDVAMEALSTAFQNNTSVFMAVMDGPVLTVGSQGLMAQMTVTKFTRKEALSEAITVPVSVKPAYGVTPAWHTS